MRGRVRRRVWPRDSPSRPLDAARHLRRLARRFPQPVLTASGGLLLLWEVRDASASLSAWRDVEIRRRHTRRPSTEAEVREWFDPQPRATTSRVKAAMMTATRMKW